MLSEDELDWLEWELAVTASELPLFRAMARDYDNGFFLCDDLLLIRKFKRWQERYGTPYPRLAEISPSTIGIQLSLIYNWWAAYVDVRKLLPDPGPKDLHPAIDLNGDYKIEGLNNAE